MPGSGDRSSAIRAKNAVGGPKAAAREEKIMRLFECGTLVPGCAWHTRADKDAEVVRRAVEHLKVTHGETIVRETMIDQIKQRIGDDAQAA